MTIADTRGIQSEVGVRIRFDKGAKVSRLQFGAYLFEIQVSVYSFSRAGSRRRFTAVTLWRRARYTVQFGFIGFTGSPPSKCTIA